MAVLRVDECLFDLGFILLSFGVIFELQKHNFIWCSRNFICRIWIGIWIGELNDFKLAEGNSFLNLGVD